MTKNKPNKNPEWEYNDGDTSSIDLSKNTEVKKPQQKGLEKIEKHTDTLSHPSSLKRKAKKIYKMSCDEDLLVGRTIYGLIGASIYTACRLENYPTPLNEIVETSRADKKEISSIYRSIKKELDLNMAPTGPKPYIYRYCNELNLDREIQEKALEIIEKTKDKKISSGKSPNGYAASAIYLASRLSNKKIPQKTLADTAYITRATIRNIYKKQITEIPEKTLNYNPENNNPQTQKPKYLTSKQN